MLLHLLEVDFSDAARMLDVEELRRHTYTSLSRDLLIVTREHSKRAWRGEAWQGETGDVSGTRVRRGVTCAQRIVLSEVRKLYTMDRSKSRTKENKVWSERKIWGLNLLWFWGHTRVKFMYVCMYVCRHCKPRCIRARVLGLGMAFSMAGG